MSKTKALREKRARIVEQMREAAQAGTAARDAGDATRAAEQDTIFDKAKAEERELSKLIAREQRLEELEKEQVGRHMEDLDRRGQQPGQRLRCVAPFEHDQTKKTQATGDVLLGTQGTIHLYPFHDEALGTFEVTPRLVDHSQDKGLIRGGDGVHLLEYLPGAQILFSGLGILTVHQIITAKTMITGREIGSHPLAPVAFDGFGVEPETFLMPTSSHERFPDQPERRIEALRNMLFIQPRDAFLECGDGLDIPTSVQRSNGSRQWFVSCAAGIMDVSGQGDPFLDGAQGAKPSSSRRSSGLAWLSQWKVLTALAWARTTSLRCGCSKPRKHRRICTLPWRPTRGLKSMLSIGLLWRRAAKTTALRVSVRIYHANYYGAFVMGPDGHNIEAVCHKPE